MNAEYRVSADQGFVRVVYQGQVSYQTSTNMMRELAKASEQGDRKFLIDVRNATPTYSHVTPIQHVEEAPSIGLRGNHRTALLGAEKDRTILQYVEDVAVNRGILVKLFFDEDEAVKWLREDVD
ncbi:MAG: hypothetical protein GX535_12300 [Xanthomonadaceae bacterium]|nr:hypothetical protein [Xanthomonadaceae bacterium]